MTFNAEKFLNDYKINYRTHGADVSPGWIGVSCPFCEDPLYHGGFNIAGGYYYCWRCHGHKLQSVIMSLLKVTFKEAMNIIRRYTDHSLRSSEQIPEHATPEVIDWPPRTEGLSKIHSRYLKSRRFSPSELCDKWGLRGTRHLGSYKFRIIAPIFFDGRMVSYQGRDVTNHQNTRYKACPKDKEIVPHKHLLYGIDHVGERCIICEGITDVWRLGYGAVATFGTKYTAQQLLLLKKKNVRKVFVMLDADTTIIADRLAADISAIGIDVEVFQLESGDPGDLPQREANKLMKNLIRR